MNFPTKKKYFRIISFILLITSHLPVFTNNMPSIIVSRQLWTPIWFISLIALSPGVFKNKFFVYVLSYQLIFGILVIGNFWLGIDSWTIKALVYDIYYFTTAFSLITYYRYSGDYYGFALLVKWAMIFVGVTAVLSIYSSIIDPLYARKITGGDPKALGELLKYGGGAYSYASVLVCLFPFMVYYYRNNSNSIFSRKQILIFGIICFIALIRMQYFANILVAVIVIFFSLFSRKRLRASLLVSIILFIIIIAIPGKNKADFMALTSNYFNKESENRRKLNDFNDYLYSDEQDTETGSRVARYPMLWEAFKESPSLGILFNKSDYKIGPGAHLYFMYKLTAFGILNFILFSFIFYYHIKVNLKIFEEGFSFYFLLSALSIIVLGLMKNLAGSLLWYEYFFIIPGLYYLPVLKRDISKYLNDNPLF